MFPVEISHITLKNLFWGQPWFHRPLLPTQWIILSEVSIISMGIIFHQSRGYMILRGSDSILTSSDARHKVSSLPDIKSTESNMSLHLHHYHQVTFMAIKSLLLNVVSSTCLKGASNNWTRDWKLILQTIFLHFSHLSLFIMLSSVWIEIKQLSNPTIVLMFCNFLR